MFWSKSYYREQIVATFLSVTAKHFRNILSKTWDFLQIEYICESFEFPRLLPCLGMDNEIHADSYYKTIKRQHYHSISTPNYPFILDYDNTCNILLK